MSEALDGLELARGGTLSFLLDGVRHEMPDPVAMSYEEIHLAIASEGRTLLLPRMPWWKQQRLMRRWAAHHDLGTLQQAQRLMYLLDRYSRPLTYDLRVHAAGADLGALWRARRWGYLLTLIDHLPSHSHYAEAVSNDPEHAEMLIKAAESREADVDAPAYAGPALHTWTPEVALLTDVLDAVKGLNYTLIAVNTSDKSKRPKPPEPSPRPRSALTAARKKAAHKGRLARHNALADRVLARRKAKPAAEAPVSKDRPASLDSGPGTAWLRKKTQITD